MARKPRTIKSDSTKTYILELKNGDIRKITFPAHYKLTFGNLLPYQGKDKGHNHEHRVALRVYGSSKEDLQAVMMDVVSFRAADIGVLERRTSVQRKGAQVKTQSGAVKDVVYEARMTEWIDPDKEDAAAAQQYAALEKAKDVGDEGPF